MLLPVVGTAAGGAPVPERLERKGENFKDFIEKSLWWVSDSRSHSGGDFGENENLYVMKTKYKDYIWNMDLTLCDCI